MGILSCGCGGKGKAGNGAATLGVQPNSSPNPPVPPVYTSQIGACSGGVSVPNAPFLVSPNDYASLPPVASVPIIEKRGRQQPNNSYVFTPNPPGVVQVQSPKVGRY